MGVVMPHGVLFRGGAEGKIRRGIVEADLFEVIIGLAPNLFSGASIPVAICVLNKTKPAERRGKVLFVDAAQEGSFARARRGTTSTGSTSTGSSRRTGLRGRGPLRPMWRTTTRSRPTTQPEHQPLRRHHGGDRGNERRGRPCAAPRRRAKARRGGGKDGRPASGVGICQKLGMPSGS